MGAPGSARVGQDHKRLKRGHISKEITTNSRKRAFLWPEGAVSLPYGPLQRLGCNVRTQALARRPRRCDGRNTTLIVARCDVLEPTWNRLEMSIKNNILIIILNLNNNFFVLQGNSLKILKYESC
jgi:hypothetical protein